MDRIIIALLSLKFLLRVPCPAKFLTHEAAATLSVSVLIL